MEIIIFVVLIIATYLTGSIPVSYLLCKKIKNVDIRTVGSKNIGATNAGRVLGKQWFFIITLLDAFKGFITVFTANYLMGEEEIIMHPVVPVLIGLIAIVSHTFSIYLNFKGGKGVAVSAGVLLALDFRIMLIGLLLFILIVAISKYISLGSIIASISMPTSYLILYYDDIDFYFLGFCLVIGFYVIFKHRTNIKRLISGTERKWGEKV